MIKGLLRIVLMSTVIFFTAQLGWSSPADSDAQNDGIGSYSKNQRAGDISSPGYGPLCLTGNCHKNEIQSNLWTDTAATTSNIKAQDVAKPQGASE